MSEPNEELTFDSSEKRLMRAIAAALVTVGIIYMVDVEYNGATLADR
jgi:hypothetical protein